MFLIGSMNKRKSKIRKKLTIEQINNCIHISGCLSEPKYEVKELLLQFEDDDIEAFTFENELSKNNFKFEINLLNNKKLFKIAEGMYKLYLTINVDENLLTETERNRIINKNKTIYYKEKNIFEYPIRLGKFQETETRTLEVSNIDGVTSNLYITVKGNVGLAINKTIKQKTKTSIDYLKSKTHELIFGGKLYTRSHEIDTIKLLVIGRENNIKTYFPISSIHFLHKETIGKFGLNRYKYDVVLNFNELFKSDLNDNDIYDLFFEIKYKNNEEATLVRIGRPRFRARKYLKSSSGFRGETVFVVSPYYTIKKFNISLQVEKYEKDAFMYMKRIMRWTWLLRPFYLRKNIWIIGERPYKAQDTGYRFFEYMRKKHPTNNCYYVIESDSPELENVSPLGNVLYYKSKKHIKYTLMAKRIISSHHPDYLYPIRTDEFNRKLKAKKVFIQHGVLGTKNIEHFYSKKSPSFSTDLFLVSSDYEKQIVINDFGYDKDEVIVTGLSRFDSLFEKDVELKRQLLIIPTWREWLVLEDEFLESDYYHNYKELVNNTKLHNLAKQFNFEILLCLHPNMQKYSHLFKSSPVRVINQGEIDVQFLLKQSSMMITDYSSVAFDFSFLSKPIIYYQFDREKFIGKKGSHIDLDNDLPGDIVFSIEDIVKTVEYYAKNDFEMKEVNKIKAKKFLKYKDQKSSERIYKAIKYQMPKRTIYNKIVTSEIFNTIFNIFRKSKYYFPTMKLFYNFLRTILPVDEKLILFESGIGKQYADSPRFIYEEIVKQNLDYKKIWVSNKNIRFQDIENTFRIKRLSPSYYYYLARAGIWVNNQNFPTYIRKPKKTIYLQTWHGTPLKRMLHDIENVQGRTDDYVERVSKAIENWDYLISPSSYATNAFRSAFKYNGEILEVGYPRNDIFYKENISELCGKIKRRLNIPKDKKVILYAPTFRDNQTTKVNKFSFDIQMDLKKMKEQLGDEYIILLRMHVVIANKIKLEEDISDFAYDVSSYSDIQELLLISDILITDYSSVMFDFANTRRPMLFFTYDFETYRDELRGFYLDFENEAPGPLVRTTEEIIDSIQNIKSVERSYNKKYEQFYQKYCYLEDGKASKRVVEKIFVKTQ